MRLLTTVRRSVSAIALGIVLAAIGVAAAMATHAGMRGELDELIDANARKTAPDFTLTDENGATVELSQYKGRVVLLDFWATWCHGCKTEIPWYTEFESKYKNRGLAVIGVSMDAGGWKSVKPFIAEEKMNYAVVIGNEALAGRYNVTAMPVTLLIDRNGKIADSHSGVVDKAAWEQEIEGLLSEGQPTVQ
jgi:peroxiredoxin